MDLSVIIVNWNTRVLLENCLKSILKFTKKLNYEIIVVDNGSKDQSVAMVKEKFPKVKLIENKDNLGFTWANNQGIKLAKGKFVLLLNSDTYLIEDSLTKLISFAKKTEKLGALGPQLLNEDRSIQQSIGFFPNLFQVFLWMSFLDDIPFGYIFRPYHVDHDTFYKKEQKVDWVTGAALLVPKKVISKVGILDEKIFMYGEEVEWCYRIRQEGFHIIYSPNTSIVHIGRGSSKKLSKNAFIGEYRGVIYFYKKYKSKLFLQIALILLKMGALLRFTIFSILGRKELAAIYVEAFKAI